MACSNAAVNTVHCKGGVNRALLIGRNYLLIVRSYKRTYYKGAEFVRISESRNRPIVSVHQHKCGSALPGASKAT